jgi:6,7-dimethyl-8-ribityllumazine synthase
VNRDIDDSSENVLSEWPSRENAAPDGEAESGSWPSTNTAVDEVSVESVATPRPAVEEELEDEVEVEPEPETAPAETGEPELPVENQGTAIAVEPSLEHMAGDLDIPEGYAVLEGVADGGRRAVGVVVARFNGNVTSRLLSRALEELELAGVRHEAITVMVVPGAFELPIAATALAKTRRFACIVALGCVVRGDTPHFDYVAGEAASGLQLAALETGVPVSFGVLTLESAEQADTRIDKSAEAVRSALEMADVFSHLRAAAAR